MTSNPSTQEETPAAVAGYRERLLPGPGWVLVVAAFIAMIAIAYGAALGSAVGWIVALGLLLLSGIALWRASPVVMLDERGLHAGRALLPYESAHESRVVRDLDLANIRRGLDQEVGDTGFVLQPPWIPARALVIELTDERDPHSSWVIGSRDPERLQQAWDRLRG